jgi:hypothetical protein
MTDVMWREEHLQNVSLLHRAHLSNVLSHDVPLGEMRRSVSIPDKLVFKY